MAPETAPEAALLLGRALEAAHVPYALGGALAFGLWGVPRGTLDVDVNVFVEEAELPRVIAAIASLGAGVDARRTAKESAAEGWFSAHWGPFRLDVFLPSIPFAWEAARTARRAPLLDGEATFLSPEAIAVFKLLFFRPKDLVDLERLVAVQGDALDAAYVRARIVDMLGADDPRVVRWDELVAAALS